MPYTSAFDGTELGILRAVFNELDTDGTGEISFDDLFEFIRGYKHALDNRKSLRQLGKLHFEPQPQYDPRSGQEVTPTFNQIAWSPDVFRTLMKQLLERKVSVAHCVAIRSTPYRL